MDEHNLHYERSKYPGINLGPLRLVERIIKWSPVWAIVPLFGFWMFGVNGDLLVSLWWLLVILAMLARAVIGKIISRLESKYAVDEERRPKREYSHEWGGITFERVWRKPEDGESDE